METLSEAAELKPYQAPAGGRLTDSMLETFERDGVLLLADFVDVAECRRLQERATELAEGFDPAALQSVFSTTSQAHLADRYFIESGDKIRFFLEAEAFDAAGRLRQSPLDSLNKIGHAMHDLDPVFDRFSRTPPLAEVARRLGFADPVIIQSMYIVKPPRIGGEVVCHQDATYIYTDPESCVGFWFALEDATLDNGCMQFIPGAHKGPLRKRNYRRPDGTLVTETLDKTPWPGEPVAAPAGAGTLVIFDGRAPHLSGPNRSDKSRHAYTLHVIDRRCEYPSDNWLQRDASLPLRGFGG